MANIPRPDNLRRRLGPLPACLISCLAAGCGDANSTSAPGPVASPKATAAAPAAQTVSDISTPAVAGAKADRDKVLAGLKERGIEVVTAQDVVVRSFRYTGLKEPLEWFVEIEQIPAPSGKENPLRIFLPPDGQGTGDGVINMVLLPPASTGRDGTRIVLQSVPDAGEGGRLVAYDAAPLWFGWAKRAVRMQSRLDGGPVVPRPGKTYKLIAYAAGDQDSLAAVVLTVKCRVGQPKGPSAGEPPGGSEGVGASKVTRPGRPSEMR